MSRLLAWVTGSGPDLEDLTMDLQLGARNLQRQSARSRGQARMERTRAEAERRRKQGLSLARLHLQNAARNDAQAVRFMQMSQKVSLISDQVRVAAETGRMAEQMKDAVRSIGAVVKGVDIQSMSKALSKFERDFLKLDQVTDTIDAKLQGVADPTGEIELGVEDELSKWEDESALDLEAQLAQLPELKQELEDEDAKRENASLEARMRNLQTK